MLITFSTDVHPDVVLFGEVATIFLRIMGEKEEPPGILRGEDIKVAMERLQSWLNQMPQRDNNDEENSDDEGDDKDDAGNGRSKRGSVGLKKRAFPLLELMNAAYRKQSDVIWR